MSDFIGEAIGGALGLIGAERAGEKSLQSAREQMAFQERMSSTAYQRAMADMKAAGLNPMLAYKTGGASSPSGASATFSNTAEGAISTALQVRSMKAELEKLEADTDQSHSATKLNNAQAQLTKAQKAVADNDALVKAATARDILSGLPDKENKAQISRTKSGQVIGGAWDWIVDRINPFKGMLKGN